ncbi:hypothetical protein FOL47_004013 [Perkinsus chesapeaki]|uniref:Uncharacterized protein n=1 Tax=Perkinsus chesapeaki TaxID=330153 RepID=A0A7J6M549_PERCH|nr:hypothetical protein FOL47_004013 [Perkinsus chesapeaki]
MTTPKDNNNKKATLGGSGSRDILPGVSKVFNPIRAQTLWKAIVGKEQNHLEKPRMPTTGMRVEPLTRVANGDSEDLDLVKYVTYSEMVPSGSVHVPKTGKQARQKKSNKFVMPSRYEGFTKEEVAARKDRDDFEERYRFFSRPFNVTKHQCEHFNSCRMRNLYEMRSESDPILLPPKMILARKKRIVEKAAEELNYDTVLDDAIEAYKWAHKHALGSGTQAQFAGYSWARYKYFAGGKNYGSTGLVSRFPVVDGLPPSVDEQRKKFKRKILVDFTAEDPFQVGHFDTCVVPNQHRAARCGMKFKVCQETNCEGQMICPELLQ